MASVVLNIGVGGANVATNAITRDTITEQMELINVADPATGVCATVDATGLYIKLNSSIPAGSANIGSVNVANTPNVSVSNTPTVNINGVPSVSQDGCTYDNIVDAVAHTVTATLLVGFQEMSGTAQTVSLTAYDGPDTTHPAMTPPITLGAGQILTFPRGGIKATSGQITFKASGVPATAIQALYHA